MPSPHTPAANNPSESVILFDGVCNLCNRFVDFVIRRDRHEKFRFASLQSDYGLKQRHFFGEVSTDPQSILFISNGKAYHRSTAALKILSGLGGFWSLAGIFLIVHPVIRNFFYDWVAKNRYRWFGKRPSCRIPSPSEAKRFLG